MNETLSGGYGVVYATTLRGLPVAVKVFTEEYALQIRAQQQQQQQQQQGSNGKNEADDSERWQAQSAQAKAEFRKEMEMVRLK